MGTSETQPRVADHETVEAILRQLSLEQKCILLSGKNMWETADFEPLSIQSLKMTDGPAGVRGAKWTDGSPTTYIPCGISLGATFDPRLIERIGVVLGTEARAKNAHVLLAPTMNISRSPFGGRNFENFGEDPHLTGKMATSYIKGVQSEGVGACMKHYVANDMETRRFNMDQTIDERTMREIYLTPFEMALEADPWTAMTAYPKINGKHADMSEHLVRDILRNEWGFDNLVMSDWGGLNDTVASIRATTDLEMPGPPIRYGKALLDALKSGQISEREHIDNSVRRLLRLLMKAGLIGSRPDQTIDASSTALNGVPIKGTYSVQEKEAQADQQEFRDISKETASSGIVLLKNDDSILPLKPSKIRRLALIGPNVEDTTHGGTGSAIVKPYYITTPLKSIQNLVKADNPNAEIRYERGIFTYLQPPLMGNQLKASALDNSGFRVDFYKGHEFEGDIIDTTYWENSLVYLMSDGDTPAELRDSPFCYRATGELTPTATGTHNFSLSNTGKAKLFVDEELLIDNTEWTQISGNFMNCGSIEVFATKHLEAGKKYQIRVDNVVVPPPTRPHDNMLFHRISGVRVGLMKQEDESAMYQAAIDAAKEADVVVMVVGHNNDTEREGSDRTSLSLPGLTDALVADLCAVNPNTVVVNQSACAVAMPWADSAKAVVQAWYQGQENGNALADVLLGKVNPSGKLPLTFPKRIEDHGSHKFYPDAAIDHVTYGEGILVGYRWFDAKNIEPLWPFGHGLSYTTFEITNSAVDGAISADGTKTATVKFTVTNIGLVDGSEVVQLYVSPSKSQGLKGLDFAPKSLAGFQKLHVCPGQSSSAELVLDGRAVRWFDVASSDEPGKQCGGRWRVDPGTYTVYIGTSSRKIAAELPLVVE